MSAIRLGRRYVNAYLVTREYGGPEEGGWWYDAGTPAGSIPVVNGPQQRGAVTLLTERLKGDVWGSIGSVRGGVELRIVTEKAPAKTWPATAPRYE